MAAKKAAKKVAKRLTQAQVDRIYNRVSEANAVKVMDTFGKDASFNWGWGSGEDENRIWCESKVYIHGKVVISEAKAPNFKRITHTIIDYDRAK